MSQPADATGVLARWHRFAAWRDANEKAVQRAAWRVLLNLLKVAVLAIVLERGTARGQRFTVTLLALIYVTLAHGQLVQARASNELWVQSIRHFTNLTKRLRKLHEQQHESEWDSFDPDDDPLDGTALLQDTEQALKRDETQYMIDGLGAMLAWVLVLWYLFAELSS